MDWLRHGVRLLGSRKVHKHKFSGKAEKVEISCIASILWFDRFLSLTFIKRSFYVLYSVGIYTF